MLRDRKETVSGKARKEMAGRTRRTPVVPRTERGRSTRQRLIDAAIQEIGAKGIAGTRVDEITQSVGCGYGTFYKYFSSKIDLVRQVMSEVYGEIHRESFASLPEGYPTEESIRDSVTRLVAAIKRHREVLLAMDRAAGIDPELLRLRNSLLHRDLEELARRIEALKKTGAGIDLDPFAASLALNSMVEEMSRRWLLYEDRLPEEVFVDTIVKIFAAVLVPDEPS